jgi:hypothetical protein
MRPTRLLLPLVALLAALLAASFAFADTTTIKDGKRETRALKKNGRVDILRASAGHAGGLLEHRVVVRKRIRTSRRRERPLIGINTRGGGSSDPEFLVYGDDIFKNRKKGDPKRIGNARLTAERRRWTYRFGRDEFPDGPLGRYGWVAFTTTAKALDVVPANAYEIHRP